MNLQINVNTLAVLCGDSSNVLVMAESNFSFGTLLEYSNNSIDVKLNYGNGLSKEAGDCLPKGLEVVAK